jgi:hypothetical protein
MMMLILARDRNRVAKPLSRLSKPALVLAMAVSAVGLLPDQVDAQCCGQTAYYAPATYAYAPAAYSTAYYAPADYAQADYTQTYYAPPAATTAYMPTTAPGAVPAYCAPQQSGWVPSTSYYQAVITDPYTGMQTVSMQPYTTYRWQSVSLGPGPVASSLVSAPGTTTYQNTVGAAVQNFIDYVSHEELREDRRGLEHEIQKTFGSLKKQGEDDRKTIGQLRQEVEKLKGLVPSNGEGANRSRAGRLQLTRANQRN